MAPFDPDDDDFSQLDWQLLQNGPVTLYRNRIFLDEDISELLRLGYEIHRFDCSTWRSFREMSQSFKQRLPGYEDYCGEGFDAVADCLADLQIPNEGGIAVVFDNFDKHPVDRKITLDVFAEASRRWSLFGRRLVVVAQTDDPDYSVSGLASTAAEWNPREWLDSKRRDDP